MHEIDRMVLSTQAAGYRLHMSAPEEIEPDPLPLNLTPSPPLLAPALLGFFGRAVAPLRWRNTK